MTTTVLVFPRATASLVRLHAPADALVVAVDGGARACLEAQRVPHVVVGDLDSAPSGVVERLEALGARVERHPVGKRDTDGALALAHARGDRVVFLGAQGGRLDHALANLHLLVAAARTASVEAIDEDHRAWVATPSRPVGLRLPRGALVSILPFGGDATGVTLRGFRWPLEDATMRTGDPYGVSNECSDDEQEIRVGSGALLVVQPLEDPRGA